MDHPPISRMLTMCCHPDSGRRPFWCINMPLYNGHAPRDPVAGEACVASGLVARAPFQGVDRGVKEPGSSARSYFARRATDLVLYGYNTIALRPHAVGLGKFSFAVELAVTSTRCRPHVPDMVAPLAKLYVWAHRDQERRANPKDLLSQKSCLSPCVEKTFF